MLTEFELPTVCPKCSNPLRRDTDTIKDFRGSRVNVRCIMCTWSQWIDLPGVTEEPLGRYQRSARPELAVDVCATPDCDNIIPHGRLSAFCKPCVVQQNEEHRAQREADAAVVQRALAMPKDPVCGYCAMSLYGPCQHHGGPDAEQRHRIRAMLCKRRARAAARLPVAAS